jgi:hypothetical protein
MTPMTIDSSFCWPWPPARPGEQPLGAVHPVRAHPRHLLLRHPAADEAASEEDRRVPGIAEGGRQGGHHERHLRHGDASSASAPCRCRSPTRSRIEVAKAAVGGYQGQDRRSCPSRGRCRGSRMNKNLRWKALTILIVLVLAVWSFYPPGEKVRLGLDLKGGVHLVMRVQTDDALRLETETTSERLREELSHGQRPRLGRSIRRASTAFVRRGRAGGSGCRVPADRRRADGATYNRESGRGSLHGSTLRRTSP